MSLKFVKSQMGANQLLVDGQRYVLDKKKEVNNEIKNYWKCHQYFKCRCPARVITLGDMIRSKSGDHNHTSNSAKISALNVMAKIKTAATSSSSTPKEIVASASLNISQAVAGQLPPIEYMKKTIQRSRIKANFPNASPANLIDLVVPETLKYTSKNDHFLLYDSKCNKRILIFSTQENLEHLSVSSQCFGDGTFKASPTLFAQIYTIHYSYSDTALPAVFALLPDKSEETYFKLFSELKKLKPTLNPNVFTTDFELATINAIRKSFDGVTQRGCYFHFSQCIWREIQTMPEVLAKYNTDPDYALNMRMLSALAFIPQNDVILAYETLMDWPFFTDDELSQLIFYFEDNWIGRPTGRQGTRRAPRFPISLWNCYETTLAGLKRTNNYIEGWHRGFNAILQAAHPTVWKVIEDFKKEQALKEMKHVQLAMGMSAPPQKKIYRDSNDRILQVIHNYNSISVIDYLRNIAQNIEYNV